VPFKLGRIGRRPAEATSASYEWLAPRSAPGSRTVEPGFFADYPDFFTTSETSAQPWRLNLRYEAIFGENRELFDGASVLDIASHDGRWSLAAARTGASAVVGIEARADLVEHAARTLGKYGVEESRYRFVAGDVFDVLAHGGIQADVVLCLGFYYHTLRYNELLTRIRQTGARTVLIDTLIRPDEKEPMLRLFREPTERQGNAVEDDFSWGDDVLVGRPSMPAMRMMGEAYGLRLESWSDWGALLRDNPRADGVRDYREGRRVTLRFAAV
jgi:predicted nicotinamide N-methyase